MKHCTQYFLLPQVGYPHCFLFDCYFSQQRSLKLIRGFLFEYKVTFYAFGVALGLLHVTFLCRRFKDTPAIKKNCFTTTR